MSYSGTSVNTAFVDMPDREAQARHAGEMLYGSTFPSDYSRSRSMSTTVISTENIILPEDKQACCGIMSPVRRTFCLLCLFDFLITFILWAIYTQVSSRNLFDRISKEILHYDIGESLFDTVMLSTWRFVPLLLAYALFRSRKPWFVAVTTTATCGFLMVKVFLFNFSKQPNNTMVYFLIIVSFIIPWIETWFLDFKVLPREHKAREREAYYRHLHERTPLLHDQDPQAVTSDDRFYSPDTSREGSDNEEEDKDFLSLPATRSHSRTPSHTSGISVNISIDPQEQEYIQRSRKLWDDVWDMYCTQEGWKFEGGKDMDMHHGCVHSKSFPQIGKVYRLQGYVECAIKPLFQEIVLRIADAPKWSPTVLDSRVLHVLDDRTDIIYTVAAEGAGGIISSRDFVSIRHWGYRHSTIVSAGISIDFPDAPKSKKHVRGENGPCMYAFKPVPGNKNRTQFTQLLNTNLKGWIPQSVIDKALGTVLMKYLGDMRQHMARVTSCKSTRADK